MTRRERGKDGDLMVQHSRKRTGMQSNSNEKKVSNDVSGAMTGTAEKQSSGVPASGFGGNETDCVSMHDLFP